MYMTQPDATTSTWLLYVGMALVCLPWFFWLVLCVYRCISRSLGFRIVFGGGGGGGDGAGSSGKRGAGGGGSATMNGNAGARDTENGDGGHARSGEVVVVNEGGGDHTGPRNIMSRSSSSTSSHNDISVKSDESEVPLALAMAA